MTSYKEDFYDLLFEVSNPNRYDILKLIKNEQRNLTNLSNNTNLNLPETRRHVTRLSEIGLIQRVPDGSYIITSLGQRVLEQLDTISARTSVVARYPN
ncbi:hypothetical protein E4H04_09135 [Candidatus Bathyarchaeota archaeon]|nr:MAG: hypothetical protein E4H04_09135 [Candidatus Bathyarchaeota archaeon]